MKLKVSANHCSAGLRNGTITMNAHRPYTTEGTAARSSTTIVSGERKRRGHSSVMYSAVATATGTPIARSEEHTSELQSPCNLVCRLLLEKEHTLRPPTLFVSTPLWRASLVLRIAQALAPDQRVRSSAQQPVRLYSYPYPTLIQLTQRLYF